MINKDLIQNWIEYQKLQYKRRIHNKMPIFQSVLVESGVQTEVVLIIDEDKIEVRARERGVFHPRIFRAGDFNGFSPEDTRITLSFDGFPDMIFLFATPQAYTQAKRLIERIANEGNYNLETPPDSSSESSSDSSHSLSTSSDEENNL